MVAVDVALQFIGREHHDHVGPFGGLRHLEHLEFLALGLLDALRALAQRDRDFLHAGIPQVERMGMALAAIAHDRNLLAFDQVQVGVPVVIYAHDSLPLSVSYCLELLPSPLWRQLLVSIRSRYKPQTARLEFRENGRYARDPLHTSPAQRPLARMLIPSNPANRPRTSSRT